VSGAFVFDGQAIARRLEPASADELGAELRALDAARGAALVVGGASRLAIGNPLRRADAVLSTARLARSLELDADEGVMLAEAGAPLEALRTEAARVGWELPLDPPGTRSTLGGALASAAPGPCFPLPRDVVLGMEVVLADGRRTRSGGRVVKNVSGYDLPKLYVGSFGALGVIASAWIRLRPLPERREVAAAAAPSDPALALEAARRPTARAAVCVDAALAGAVLEGGGGATAGGGTFVIEIAGDEAAVAADRAWLAERLGGAAAGAGALDRVRDLLGGASPAGAPRADLAVRVAVVPTRVAAAAEALRAAGAAVIAQPARGLLHARVSIGHGGDGEHAFRLLAAAREVASAGRGSVRVEAAPLELKRRIGDVFGDPGTRLPLLRRLKAEYDPHGVLNPGRFAGCS
jgi:glycolate oxidase FAD binding subunit